MTLVLVYGERIYDSDAMKMKYTGAVLEGNRIKEMGRFEELSQACPNVRIMDPLDGYILPGLVNTHAHLEFTPCRGTYDIYRRGDREARLVRVTGHARTFLRSGVTAIRDTGSSTDLVGALFSREVGSEPGTELSRIQAVDMPLTPGGGRLAFLGETSNSTGGLVQAIEEGKSASRGRVKLIVDRGQLTPGSVPEYNTCNRGGIWAAVEAARELGLLTAVHCPTISSYANVMKAGVDNTEHYTCSRRSRHLGLLGRCYEPDVMEAFRGDHRHLMIGVPDNYHQLDQVRGNMREPDEREAFLLERGKRECGIFSCLTDLGMRPLVGTDAGCGYTFFDETWLETELSCKRYDLTPEKAIHAVTLEGARALGYGDFLGWLVPGYEAGSIIVAQNPTQDMETFRHIKRVVYRRKIIK